MSSLGDGQCLTFSSFVRMIEMSQHSPMPQHLRGALEPETVARLTRAWYSKGTLWPPPVVPPTVGNAIYGPKWKRQEMRTDNFLLLWISLATREK